MSTADPSDRSLVFLDQLRSWMSDGEARGALNVGGRRLMELCDEGSLRYADTVLGRLFDPHCVSSLKNKMVAENKAVKEPGKRVMGVGKRIREVREALLLTQEELGQKSRIARNSVARIEQGRQWPSAATLDNLATALGVEPDDLFPKKEEKSA